MHLLNDEEIEFVSGGQEIVVVGVRPDAPWLPNYNNPPQPGGGTTTVPNYPYPGGSVYNYLYDYTNGPYDAFKQEINVDLDRDATPLEKQAIDFLKHVAANAGNLFSTANFGGKVAVDGNGHTINGSVVANSFKNVDFLITNATYDNGGVGRANTKNGLQGQDILLEINISGLVNYMGSPSVNGDVLFPDMNEGLIWLAHELGHVTTAGQQMNEMAGLPVNFAPPQGYGSPFVVGTKP
jgi:hypothetical protein